MVRQDLGDNLIELKHSSGVDLWFVVKKELPASSVSMAFVGQPMKRLQ